VSAVIRVFLPYGGIILLQPGDGFKRKGVTVMKNKLLVRRGMFCAMVVLGLFVTAFFAACDLLGEDDAAGASYTYSFKFENRSSYTVNVNVTAPEAKSFSINAGKTYEYKFNKYGDGYVHYTFGPADDVIESGLLSQQGLTVFVNKQ